MRLVLIMAGLVLLAGCVDPAATHSPPPVDDDPPQVPHAVVVKPSFALVDEEGLLSRQIMLGDTVLLNATATPTDNLTELSHHWVEQGDVLLGSVLWSEAHGQSRPAVALLTPRHEGTHPVTVTATSETGHRASATIHLGVSASEEWSFTLEPASPLGSRQPCRPAYGILGEPASTRAPMDIIPVPLPREYARFSADAAPGVEVAWCRGDQALATWQEGEWLHLAVEPEWHEVELWVANVDADQVVVRIERHYPGDPLH